jgi:hypothetical protein
MKKSYVKLDESNPERLSLVEGRKDNGEIPPLISLEAKLSSSRHGPLTLPWGTIKRKFKEHDRRAGKIKKHEISKAKYAEINSTFYQSFHKIRASFNSEADPEEGIASGALLIRKNYQQFKQGYFDWELHSSQTMLQTIIAFLKDNFEFKDTIDVERINPQLYQEIFPIELVNYYLSSDCGPKSPGFLDVLKLQLIVIEVFKLYHIRSDTRFWRKIYSEDIKLMDPFMRIAVRKYNRNSSKFHEKYFSPAFDLKKWVLNDYLGKFQSTGFLAIGPQGKLLKCGILKCFMSTILALFELGLWTVTEVHQVADVLLNTGEKILAVLNYPDDEEIRNSSFFPKFKKLYAKLCIHMLILVNDHHFEMTHIRSKINADPNSQNIPAQQFFNDSILTERIFRMYNNFVLFPCTDSEQTKDSSTEDLTKLLFSSDYDLHYASLKALRTEDYELYQEFFAQKTSFRRKTAVEDFAVKIIDDLSQDSSQKAVKEAEKEIVVAMQHFQSVFDSKSRGDKFIFTVMAMDSTAVELVCLLNMSLQLDMTTETRSLILQKLINLCKDSDLNKQVLISRQGIAHLSEIMPQSLPLTLELFESVFARTPDLFLIKPLLFDLLKDEFSRLCVRMHLDQKRLMLRKKEKSKEKKEFEIDSESEIDSEEWYFYYDESQAYQIEKGEKDNQENEKNEVEEKDNEGESPEQKKDEESPEQKEDEESPEQKEDEESPEQNEDEESPEQMEAKLEVERDDDDDSMNEEADLANGIDQEGKVEVKQSIHENWLEEYTALMNSEAKKKGVISLMKSYFRLTYFLTNTISGTTLKLDRDEFTFRPPAAFLSLVNNLLVPLIFNPVANTEFGRFTGNSTDVLFGSLKPEFLEKHIEDMEAKVERNVENDKRFRLISPWTDSYPSYEESIMSDIYKDLKERGVDRKSDEYKNARSNPKYRYLERWDDDEAVMTYYRDGQKKLEELGKAKIASLRQTFNEVTKQVSEYLQTRFKPIHSVSNIDRRAYLTALLEACTDFEFSLPEFDLDFLFLKDGFTEDLARLRESLHVNILFEILYETFELLNALTQNSYFQCHSYQQLKKSMPQILPATEAIMSRCMPLEKRTIILRLFSNLCIFPVKGEIPMNERSLNSSIPNDHLNGEIIQLIRNELKFIPLLGFNLENLTKNTLKETENGFSKRSMKYYLHEGLFPLIYKYCAGIYYNMTHDSLIEVLLNSLCTFEVRFYENLVKGSKNFDLSLIQISKEISESPEYKQRIRDGKSEVFRPLVREEEVEESMNPIMKPIRSLLERILMNISINCIQYCQEMQQPYNLAKYWKDSALTYKIENTKTSAIYKMIQPDCSGILALLKDKSKLEGNSKKTKKKTELKKLISEYKSSKVAVFMTESGPSDYLKTLFENKPDNLCKQLVQKMIKMTRDAVMPSKKSERNFTFAQILFQDAVSEQDFFILFALIDNLVLENEGYKQYMTPTDKKKDIIEFHKSMTILMNSLVGLIYDFIFMDEVWIIAFSRLAVLSSYLKNMCENNSQEQKISIGRIRFKMTQESSEDKAFVYQLQANQEEKEEEKTLIEHVANMALFFLEKGTKISTNQSPNLEVVDRSEYFPVVELLLKTSAEFLCGPCEQNQTVLYKHGLDVIVGIVTRRINDVDSPIFSLKNLLMDYLLSLTENTEHGEENLKKVLTECCSKLIVTEIFKTTESLILQLSYFCKLGMSSGSPKDKFWHNSELPQRARETDKQKIEDETYILCPKVPLNTANEILQKDLKTKSKLWKEVDFEESVVTVRKEMECALSADFTLPNLLDLYISKEDFSDNVLLHICVKLFKLLLKFEHGSNQYKTSVQLLFISLIEIFSEKEKIPFFIRSRVTNIKATNKVEETVRSKVFMFLAKITDEVELVNKTSTKNSNIQVIYQRHPSTFLLTTKTKQEFEGNYHVNEMVPKLVFLWENMNIEMKDNLQRLRALPWTKYASNDSIFRVQLLLYFLAIVFNSVFIAYFKRIGNDGTYSEGGFLICLIIGSISCGISVIGIILALISRGRQNIEMAKHLEPERKEKDMSRIQLLGRAWRLWAMPILMDQYIQFFLYYILSLALGLLVHPVFFPFSLILIVYISKTAGYIAYSIYSQLSLFAETLLLAVLVMYIYSIITMDYFYNELTINSAANTSGVKYCNALWECTEYVISAGFRAGGGIGDQTLLVNPYTQPGDYVRKFFYDFLFFMMIKTVLLNIILGIIVDSFANLRDAENDKRNIFMIGRKGSKGDVSHLLQPGFNI